MAISFSRPDPSSPPAVGSASFPLVRRGFDQGEVRDFLRMVAAELARLQERERFLENELRAMQTRGMSSPGRLDEEMVTTLLGEEAARVLSTARDASTQIRERAEESATRLVKDAAEDASRIREAAMLDAARLRDDATADAESEIEMAKQQGRDMVNEAREYREKVLSELSRRRDAARAQIEQLLHGRDRLINAFQRARIATDDVLGEITDAHEEPEFIINLAPTTGPVPIVNPAHPSVSSGVQVFDREVEDPTPTPSLPAHRPTEPRTLIDIPIDGPISEGVVTLADSRDELVVEESVEADEHTVMTVDVVNDENVAADGPIVEEATLSAESTDEVGVPEALTAEPSVSEPVGTDDEPHSNVVSLFGRNRRPLPAPDAIEVEEEVSTDLPEPSQKTGAALDDIFSKLRTSSIADVVERTVSGTGRTEIPETPETGAPTSGAPRGSETHPVSQVQSVIVPDPSIFIRRDEVVATATGAIGRHLKRVLVDEQNSVLGHVATKKSSLDLDHLLGAVEDQALRYVNAIAAEAADVAGAGSKNAGGSTRRVSREQLLNDLALGVADAIVTEFRREVSIAIGEADGDRAVLSELLRDVYRAWKSHKLDAAAGPIADRSYGFGAMMSLEPGVGVAWMVPTDGCCSDCEDNSLAGMVRRGDDFPTGHAHAPAHTGCRCLVWPVRK